MSVLALGFSEIHFEINEIYNPVRHIYIFSLYDAFFDQCNLYSRATYSPENTVIVCLLSTSVRLNVLNVLQSRNNHLIKNPTKTHTDQIPSWPFEGPPHPSVDQPLGSPSESPCILSDQDSDTTNTLINK